MNLKIDVKYLVLKFILQLQFLCFSTHICICLIILVKFIKSQTNDNNSSKKK